MCRCRHTHIRRALRQAQRLHQILCLLQISIVALSPADRLTTDRWRGHCLGDRAEYLATASLSNSTPRPGPSGTFMKPPLHDEFFGDEVVDFRVAAQGALKIAGAQHHEIPIVFDAAFSGSSHGKIRIDVARFKEPVDGVIRQTRDCGRAPGVDRLYVSGEPEAQRRVEYLRDGIPLNEATIRELSTTAAEFGVEMEIRKRGS